MINFRNLTKHFHIIRDKNIFQPIFIFNKKFHDEFTNPKLPQQQTQINIPAGVKSKYKLFQDEDAPEIFDIVEEKNKIKIEDEQDQYDSDLYSDINLSRGLHGVFDIEDLVNVLRRENAEDIIVVSVPTSLKYVDYMCIVTGRSFRHMRAMAEFVRRVYKMKRTRGDILPKIEGENSKDWMALDLGNIALHIFSPEARSTYDLESLWSIGPEYDRECNKPEDPMIQLFQQHSAYFSELKPKE